MVVILPTANSLDSYVLEDALVITSLLTGLLVPVIMFTSDSSAATYPHMPGSDENVSALILRDTRSIFDIGVNISSILSLSIIVGDLSITND
jgi:hypothetical protein